MHSSKTKAEDNNMKQCTYGHMRPLARRDRYHGHSLRFTPLVKAHFTLILGNIPFPLESALLFAATGNPALSILII
jgi:hypothetical protein